MEEVVVMDMLQASCWTDGRSAAAVFVVSTRTLLVCVVNKNCSDNILDSWFKVGPLGSWHVPKPYSQSIMKEAKEFYKRACSRAVVRTHGQSPRSLLAFGAVSEPNIDFPRKCQKNIDSLALLGFTAQQDCPLSPYRTGKRVQTAALVRNVQNRC